jgi:hypothetical protein
MNADSFLGRHLMQVRRMDAIPPLVPQRPPAVNESLMPAAPVALTADELEAVDETMLLEAA